MLAVMALLSPVVFRYVNLFRDDEHGGFEAAQRMVQYRACSGVIRAFCICGACRARWRNVVAVLKRMGFAMWFSM